MKPKIGFSTRNIKYDGPDKVVMKVMEINPKDPSIDFSSKNRKRATNVLKGKDLSMHTQTKRAFSDKDPDLNLMEVMLLKSEIILCKELGCKQLVVHLKQDKLTKKQEKMFREVLEFAKKRGVEPVLEPNNQCIAKNFLDHLKRFPKLKCNLDLGHLNSSSRKKTLGMSIEEFISKIKDRVIYIHAHNNKGEDTHQSLDDGTLDWKAVLDLLDMSKVKKIIIEARGSGKVIRDTEKLLKNYLKSR